MTLWQALVLGVVQGLTEFLPVSSSGHLVVAEAWIGIRTPGVTLEVTVHAATLLAVIVVYRARIGELTRGVLSGGASSLRYVGLIVLAAIPAGVAGVWLTGLVEQAFDSLTVVGIGFLTTGIVLWSTRAIPVRERYLTLDARRALAIGFAQALALVPGISRSGTTVSTGIWSGLEPVYAAEFSFLLSIPVIAGATILEIPELAGGIAGIPTEAVAVSFVASLLSGIFAIRFLIFLLRRQAFYQFAPYCWLLGAATIVWSVIRV